jgi:hypothetical protein
MAEVALGHHRLAGRELALGRDRRDGIELVVRNPRQKRM